jgi:hypothetical protein
MDKAIVLKMTPCGTKMTVEKRKKQKTLFY